ncbi:MAG: hypothetical protein V1752_01675 [Candidatus Firestonebacteria bacterium]
MKEKKDGQKIHRRKFIILPSSQLKYIGIMLSTVFLTSFFVGAGVYLTLMDVFNKSLPNISGRQLFAHEVFSQANQFLLLFIPVLVIGVTIISILVTHKISGPEYRLKKILDSIGNGDFSVNVKLRKGDELQSLAAKIEEVSRNISFMVKNQQQMLSRLDIKLRMLAQEVRKAKPNKARLSFLAGNLEDTSKRLKEDFNGVKIINI